TATADGIYGGHRAVLKDPAGSCYIHLIFYSYGQNGERYGVSEPVAYMDGYLSTGWDSSADGSPGTCKLMTWRNLPAGALTGVDFYSGTTSQGRLWVHVAVEEKPLVFTHMGFGSLEKTLSFTGGDFIFANGGSGVNTGSNNSATVHATYCSRQYVYVYNEAGRRLVPGFYAPDLDYEGKSDQANLYRTMAGTDPAVRPDMDLGCTSLRYTEYLSDGVTASAGGGGDMTPATFPLPNPWSGTSPLFPISVYVTDARDRNYKGQVAYFKGVRALNVMNFNPKDDITLGSDVWTVFPICCKTGVLADRWNSKYQGFAVLKNG
ncbi:MAG: hypothetical protein LBW85_08565, partial [Deltaproteobacteria bacterium]|nr:hypothetical protein [Deltaproteobacteria bacterium]